MLTKRLRRRQWKQKKKTKTKTTFFHFWHTCLYISLPLFCTTTTWNSQKLPSYTFYGGNVVCGPVHFFFLLPLIFTLVAASISHFLTATIKFSCYSATKLVFFAFFISGSSSFTVIHANEGFKIKSKERIGFVVVVFNLYKSGWLCDFTAERRGYLKCKISLRLTWRGELSTDVLRTDDFLRTKISWMHSLLNFFTHGAPLRALRAGELRQKYSVTKAYQETNTGNWQY